MCRPAQALLPPCRQRSGPRRASSRSPQRTTCISSAHSWIAWRTSRRTFSDILFGKKFIVDVRIDQTYLRSQPVNSEEGAPMGIGVWCEMVVSEPLDYIYKNTDPLGSLRANISNAAVDRKSV